MALFDKHHDDIVDYLGRYRAQGRISEYQHTGIGHPAWPTDKNRNLVLAGDTAVELGNPKDVSISFLYWLEKPALVANARISVIGPDISEAAGRRLSFGKVVIIGGTGFDGENRFGRYREMEMLRYDMHLKGYMMRAASRYGQEWSRVSHEALEKSFSFAVLGGAIIDKYMKLDYVRSVEVIFITAGRDDVLALRPTGDKIAAVIGAMNKMAAEMTFDCDICEYTAVCGDVAELRSMRKALERKETGSHA